MTACDDLFLSPHLDDAVFSCAGRIAQCVDAGRHVRIATVFSHADQALETLCDAASYQQRRREDARAVGCLGAANSWLELPDAPFRSPRYHSYETLLLGPVRDSEATRQRVRDAVLAEIRQCQPQVIYLPLAVGTHVDHRLVFELWPILRRHGTLRFYEDRPYALVAQAVRLRLRQISSQVTSAPDLGASSQRQVLAAHFRGWRRVRFIAAHLPAGAERLRCAQAVARQLRLAPPSSGPQFDFEVSEFTTAEVGQVLPAISSYASQLGAFIGKPSEIRGVMRSYASSLGSQAPHAERYWWLA